MKSFALFFAFLFLGLTALGQTTVNSNGLFELKSEASLCDSASPVALPRVHLTDSLQLSETLGGCQIELVQAGTGIHRVRLAKAHTRLSIPDMKRRSTEIVGVVPSAVRPGDATLYIKTVQPVQQPDGAVVQNVVSSVGIPVKVGEVASRAAVIEFPLCDGECETAKGLDLMIETAAGPTRAVLVGEVAKIEYKE
jgi:hypothetical protein